MKAKILFPLFFIFLITASLFMVDNVFSADAYGNNLWAQSIYQNAVMTGSFNNVTYSEGMNITISNYLWDDFAFITTTRVNTTVIGDGGYVNSYQGVAIQVYDENLDSVYATGIYSSPIRLFDPDPFETISWMTDIIELDLYETMFYVNITLWHNYAMTGNVTDYELTESWKFNLVAKNFEEEEEEEELVFTDLYLIGFGFCGLLCPISISGAIKLRNVFFIRIAILSGLGVIIFFFLLINVTPFGG